MNWNSLLTLKDRLRFLSPDTEGAECCTCGSHVQWIHSILCNKAYTCYAAFVTHRETVESEFSVVRLEFGIISRNMGYNASVGIAAPVTVTSDCTWRNLRPHVILRSACCSCLPLLQDNLFVPSLYVKIPDPWRLDQYITQMLPIHTT